MTKAERIKSTLRETRERRKALVPVVYQLKLQNLSRKKEKLLERACLEAKWLYNWLVADLTRLDLPANKVSEVEVKVGEHFEKRELTVLGSQIKQEIADRTKDNLRALARLRKTGHKTGRLKFKRAVTVIPLKQYGVTYGLDFVRNRVRIQKLGDFRVLGLHQIPSEAEMASAVLVRKPGGYYLHVTCYLPREYFCRPYRLREAVGIDFGVETKLTLSNGIRIDFEVHETPRLKRLQRGLTGAQKGSSNREKILLLLSREYEKLNHRRRDAQNKVLAFLRLYSTVVFQDDCVKGWAALFGRQVHSSGIGGLKARLRDSLAAPVLVNMFEPTSQECFACGKRHTLSLSDRVIRCHCGWVCDRDHNSSLVALRKGLGLSPDQAVGLDWPELKPPEREVAARILGSNPCIRVSFLR